METIRIEKDIPVFYVQAESFPEGILQVHQQLHSLIPYNKERRYFGLSRPENGVIVYRAAVEEVKEGEGRELLCPLLIIPKGNYYTITIKDFGKTPNAITRAFAELLLQSDIDPQGYCVEEYLNNRDVRCMVRIA